MKPLFCGKFGRIGNMPGGVFPRRDCWCCWGFPIRCWMPGKVPTRLGPQPFDAVELKLLDCPSDRWPIIKEFKEIPFETIGLESGKPVDWVEFDIGWLKFRLRVSSN